MRFFTGVVVAAFLAATSSPAAARDLTPDLPCALTSAGQGATDAPFCFKVFNTCNTPITSTVRDTKTGVEQDTPQIPKGERGKVCGAHPFEFVGHTLNGP